MKNMLTTVISVDSYEAGVGNILLQNKFPWAYTSEAMIETQTRYAQIEKELLAICFGLGKFHQHIFGKCIIVETAHQPLLSIFTTYVVANSKIRNRCSLSTRQNTFII